MTAEEKILTTVPASISVIDLPSSPFYINGEKGNLYNAAIELHFIKGSIEYGKLHSINDSLQEISFIPSQGDAETRVKYEAVRFVLFPTELQYQLIDHPLENKAAAVAKPELPQSFNIRFTNGSCLMGDSAISVIGESALHLFKVKDGNIATRMFIPKLTVDQFSLGEQIGEVRDEETAKIAVKAAQTGHLVLSTLHTNSAADTIVRLREMHVEPYMISTAMLGIVAQRLIKQNCPHCRVEEDVSITNRQLLGLGEEEKFYVGEGCHRCDKTGVSGRVPAYEFLNVTPSIQQTILQKVPSSELKELAYSWGMKSLSDCALKYARAGETSIAEVHRIYTTNQVETIVFRWFLNRVLPR